MLLEMLHFVIQNYKNNLYFLLCNHNFGSKPPEASSSGFKFKMGYLISLPSLDDESIFT